MLYKNILDSLVWKEISSSFMAGISPFIAKYFATLPLNMFNLFFFFLFKKSAHSNSLSLTSHEIYFYCDLESGQDSLSQSIIDSKW